MTFRAFANLPGEMARRIREMDWSATPLGGSEAWPESLTLSIAMILASGFPMAIRWGPELVLVYNDAYRPILRDKHPEALGRSLREVWWEIYPELGPLNEAIPRGQRGAFFAEDHPWAVRRQGAIVEDARFTISYSPIPDEASPNGIGGVLTTCIETHLRDWASCSCARRNFASASRRSVISRVIFANPSRFPSSSRMASIATLAKNREPSLRTRYPSAV